MSHQHPEPCPQRLLLSVEDRDKMTTAYNLLRFPWYNSPSSKKYMYYANHSIVVWYRSMPLTGRAHSFRWICLGKTAFSKKKKKNLLEASPQWHPGRIQRLPRDFSKQSHLRIPNPEIDFVHNNQQSDSDMKIYFRMTYESVWSVHFTLKYRSVYPAY